MPATIILEDGTGVATANSYVDSAGAFASTYFASHLYKAEWTAATDDQKAAACIMATRVIESSVEWNGMRSTDVQELGFPRYGFYYRDAPIDSDLIPAELKKAVCEQALLLLRRDRTSDATRTAPVESISLGKGALDLKLKAAAESSSISNALSNFVAALLRPLISQRVDTSGGTVRTVRT